MAKKPVKFCPKCQGTDIAMVLGGKLGLYECRKCGFRSALFPEKEADAKNDN